MDLLNGGNNYMKKILLILVGIFTLNANAVIPGFGLNYGKNTFYIYGEYNCNTRVKNDQYFLSYFEYGLTDWQSITLQNISYIDNIYYDMSIGILQQIFKHDYLNIRAGASYIFGPGQNNFEDGMYYNVMANGKIYNNFGYIYQLGVTHIFNYKPNWSNSIYLTYNINDDFAIYASMMSDFVKFEDNIDFSIGYWYTILTDKYNIKWVTLYFDISNIIEHTEDIRLSIGIDILF
jgi:hypothetical protein